MNATESRWGYCAVVADDLVERVHDVAAAIVAQDGDRLVALSDPDVQLRSFFALAEGGEYRGHDGLREYVRDLGDAWEKIEPEIEDTIRTGDVVIAVGRLHYRGRGSGVDSEARAGWLFCFDDGKIVVVRSFTDPERMFKQLGAS